MARQGAAVGGSTASAPLPDRWLLLSILTTSYGAGSLGMLGLSPLSPSLLDGFGLTRFQLAFILPAIYVGGLFFSLPGGRLADRIGVRPSFLGGLAVGSAGFIAAALAPSFPLFLGCLVVAGIGWCVVNPALGRAIVDVFPMRERGIAMGIKPMGLTLGRGGGRRTVWLALTGALGAGLFAVYAVRPVPAPAIAEALAFATGVGAYGWVGVFFVISAEAGGPRQAGLLTGVAYASIVVGLLVGPPAFGLLLEGSDSYAAAWTAFAALSALVTITMLSAGPMINRTGPGLPRA